MKIDKDLIKKTYTKQQLKDMLKEMQAIIMSHAEEIARLRRQQEELVKNCDVLSEIIGEYSI